MANAISVIICCYNSSHRLPKTLQYLASQRTENIKWEVIVVDNNSTDDTSKVAITEWQEAGAPVPLIVIQESNSGLSHARAAGIKQAKYDLLLFCDDDNWLETDYIASACQLMQRDAGIGILGGLNTPISTVALPEWFGRFESAYACGPQAPTDGEVLPDRLYITGAGMVIRRAVFEALDRVGFRSKLTDRKGEELSSGGDTELCFAAAIMGFKLVYSSALRLFHFMDPKRLTWEYAVKLNNGHAKSFYKLLFYKKLYRGEALRRSWFKELVSKRKEIVSSEGVLMLYHAYLKGNKAVGDVFNIEMRGKLEMLKAHLAMRVEYQEFMDDLLRFHTSAKGTAVTFLNSAE
jgi:glycosyltransferase involved in cell wall biosynthesis